VFLAYTGVCLSAIQFAVALMIYSSLQTLDIHPDDFSSALTFEQTFKGFIVALQVLAACSFTSISLGVASCINLYFQPTVYGQITARVGYLTPPVLVIFVVFARIDHMKVSLQLLIDRALAEESQSRRNTLLANALST
jgi:hypothetical protein